MSGPPDKKPKRRESWLGTVLTGVLCLGFLYWWFKPARPEWAHQSTAQYVARALAEPPGNDPASRLVLDFDLMETALLQAREGMAPEGLESALRIVNPIVQARAVRQLAQAHLNNDPKRMGDALTMCDRITDPAARERMRGEIILQIAAMGFADVALPEAKTLSLRAKLARRMAETDGQEMARQILQEVEAALPSLPLEEAAALREEAAWTRVSLALTDGPQQAFPAIQNLPLSARGEYWLELFRLCFGLGDNAAQEAAAVVARITDPALKRRMELEALDLNISLRPAEEILAELNSEVKSAAPGQPRIQALMTLADAQRRTTDPASETPAGTLRLAYNAALALDDPVERATQLSTLTSLLDDSLLFAEAENSLKTAISAARTITTPDQRLPVLILVMRQAFNSGKLQPAAELAAEALSSTSGTTPEPDDLRDLADFLVRIGDWPAGLSLLARMPDPAARATLLDELTATAAADSIGFDASQPPNRGQPLDRIRERSIHDETGASLLIQELPAGQPRARAWLALAKGQLLSPGMNPAAPAGPDPSFTGNIPMDGQLPADYPPVDADPSGIDDTPPPVDPGNKPPVDSDLPDSSNPNGDPLPKE